MTFLSKDQLYFINQSAETRKILTAEKKVEARERESERRARMEQEYLKSQKVPAGKLVSEWRTEGEGMLARHELTGMLCLGSDRVADGDSLSVRFDGENVVVRVRYSYSGALREITGCYGDREGKTPIKLAQGMKATWAEDEPEPEPAGWHLKYSNRLWRVVKGNLCAGEFPELEAAQELVSILEANDRTKPVSNDIQYRRF